MRKIRIFFDFFTVLLPNKATSPASIDSTSAASSANEDISQQEENPATATITVSAVEVTELISDRISRLRENENLEEAARAVLKHLGRNYEFCYWL
ncbi:MAG: hypothetical protein V7L11_28165 [Nostoc sp.]|uniref:hypothetical protein n=1 Tax=Nostoc sp. TaxID=1180 RepID=UPI002FF7088B